MSGRDVTAVSGADVQALLAGRELELIEVVRAAYEAHAVGRSSLPHSTFLRFPANARNRIIALPAYLDLEEGVAGVKWVSSFPANHERGFDRASAMIILNSAETGRPEAILEGAVISAKRTAASAALAARHLSAAGECPRVGVIGCGLINFEIVRFLLAVFPEVGELVLLDTHAGRAERFGARCARELKPLSVKVAGDVGAVLSSCTLVSFATTGLSPYVSDLARARPGSTLLHISLRDLTPEAILASDNIVDDVDHVCRAETSIHLAEQLVGNRDFIRCTLADITSGRAPARTSPDGVAVFSPFGIGVLDLAVGRQVLERARGELRGTVLNSFLPESWGWSQADSGV